MRILVLAGDADGNLGDQAIRYATIAAVRSILPSAEIALSTRRPDRLTGSGLRLLRRGPFGLPGLLAAMARADLVLVGGGGLFQDDDSLVKMPYWSVLVLISRLGGARTAGYAVGVGPLDAASSRLAARLAFAMMERITVRDEIAAELVSGLTSKNVEILPDPALLLVPSARDEARGLLREAGVPLGTRPVIAVAARPWWPPARRLVPRMLAARLGLPLRRDERGSARLVAGFAALLRGLADARDAFVLFLPSYSARHEGDAAFAQEVARHIPEVPHAQLRLDDARQYAAVCREVDFLVAGRMHPAILATAVGTPAFGIGYNPKFAGFFRLIGHPERLVGSGALVEEGFDPKPIVARMLAAWEQGAPDREEIAALQRRILRQTRAILATA